MERHNDHPCLIVIEGLDGSGKATQAALLTDRLLRAGRQAIQISFPDYDSPSSALVRLYLSGALGEAEEVNAYAASIFYAADRYISYANRWKKDYQAGHTIVADRYTTSNAAHQMAKLSREQWDGYLDWLYDCEFDRLRLPRPDLVLYLDLPPEASRRLLRRRYTEQGGKEDIHERNLDYLFRCREAALYAADRLKWRVINGCPGGEILPADGIADIIWEIVQANR